MQAQEFVRFVQRHRFTLVDEKQLQKQIEEALIRSGIQHRREVRLNEKDIPDFMFDGGLVAEVKIKGQRRAIYDQCARYCAHPDVTGLVLVTNVAMGFPSEIEGKPCYVANLSRGWM